VKLLLDHNISHKLVARLADIFPDSTQTRLLNFGRTNDAQLWLFAKTHDYVFVTKDRDVAELAILRGAGSDRTGAVLTTLTACTRAGALNGWRTSRN
jgi:predicted nuclease of predicted toxin-antitoxin system